MNATIFRRMFWKEYRAQRAFWISMALLTLVVEWLLQVGRWDADYHRVQSLFAVGLGLAAFYALGSAATLFAAEREAETYDFLCALPVNPLVVFAGKAAFALIGTAAMFLVAWISAMVLARGLPKPLVHETIWTLCGLGGIEFLAWGVLFSLLLKRPLLATIFAGSCVSIILNGFIVADLDFIETAPGRLLIVALVAVTDIGLARRWFREKLLSPVRSRSAGLSEYQIEEIFNLYLPWRLRGKQAREASGGVLSLAPSAPAMLGRLLWQETRQSAAVTAGLIVMLLPMVLLFYVNWLLGIQPEQVGWAWFRNFLPVLVFAGLFTAPLLGSSVFLADQAGCRFRFLAGHGVPPRLVWLSRQIRGLLVMLLGLLLILPPLIGMIATDKHLTAKDGVLVIEFLLGFAALAYACGQLCSMGIRSGILAAAFGTILTFALCGWAAIMRMLGLSWLWSVAPIPLAFMLVTWLHTPDWLVERKTWRARLRLALMVAVPALAILVAIPLVRVYEFPLVGPGFDVEESSRPVTAEEQETLALYERATTLQRQAMKEQGGAAALGSIPPPARGESARRKAEEQAVALAMEISNRPLVPVIAPDHEDVETHLAYSLLANGERLQSEGKLDAALDRYAAAERFALRIQKRRPDYVLDIRLCEQLTRWGAQRGQTSQRVLKGLRIVEELWRNPLSYSGAIKQEYLWELRSLQSDLKDPEVPRYWYDPFALMCWLPWEQARAVRLLNQLTAQEFARYKEAEAVLAAGGFLAEPPDEKISPALAKDFVYGIVRPMVTSYARLVLDGRVMSHGFLSACLSVETHRRATRLLLALEAWKLDHGRPPDSLEDLEGKYLDQLPVDPYTGSAFRYEAKGLPYYMTWHSPNSTDRKTLEPGRPFVSCDLWFPTRSGTNPAGDPRPPKQSQSRAAAASLRTEVWEGVWVFPIP